MLESNASCSLLDILSSFNLNTGSDLRSPPWNDKRHHKRTQSDRALDWKAHSQRLCSVHRWSILCIFTWTALMYIYSSFLTLWTLNFQRPKWELVSGLCYGSGAFQVSSLEQWQHIVGIFFNEWKLSVLFLCRSELSVEKTSVLQSELQSCNQLQELEPLNKCKWF